MKTSVKAVFVSVLIAAGALSGAAHAGNISLQGDAALELSRALNSDVSRKIYHCSAREIVAADSYDSPRGTVAVSSDRLNVRVTVGSHLYEIEGRESAESDSDMVDFTVNLNGTVVGSYDGVYSGDVDTLAGVAAVLGVRIPEITDATLRARCRTN